MALVYLLLYRFSEVFPEINRKLCDIIIIIRFGSVGQNA